MAECSWQNGRWSSRANRISSWNNEGASRSVWRWLFDRKARPPFCVIWGRNFIVRGHLGNVKSAVRDPGRSLITMLFCSLVDIKDTVALGYSVSM